MKRTIEDASEARTLLTRDRRQVNIILDFQLCFVALRLPWYKINDVRILDSKHGVIIQILGRLVKDLRRQWLVTLSQSLELCPVSSDIVKLVKSKVSQ